MLKNIAIVCITIVAVHFCRKAFIIEMHSFWSTIATDYMMHEIELGASLSEWRMDKLYGALGSPRRNYWKLRNWSLSGFAVNSDANKVIAYWKEHEHGFNTHEGNGAPGAQGAESGGDGRSAETASASERAGLADEARATPAPPHDQGSKILGAPLLGADSFRGAAVMIPHEGKVISLTDGRTHHRTIRRT